MSLGKVEVAGRRLGSAIRLLYYAAQPLYPASPRSSYMLSPLSPDASPSEVRKRARDRRRACAHLRTCE